jgi:ABC-type branched-subunit amino acid transport system ATPase component
MSCASREYSRILRSKEEAMLLVEQNAPGAATVSDYFYVLRSGKVMAEGETGSLPEDVSEFLGKFYL